MMGKVVEKVMQTDLMSSLLEDLSEEERKDFDEWISATLAPLEDLACIVNDMASTTESSEKLSEVVHQVLSPEGFKEVSKWLEKS